ncbi:histidine kinase [Mucilaginibacter rigui]|uniref:Histidine kinase n=1 Tax=Mucilaginibacter rigui TaxID=534635 RepID=A0ABR7X8E8_9SPHI|nr:histidine kinase [Mucilaginibacter rigui]MBD1386819.1 histidine kinase [Mucilaginibacter rigui]
MNNKPHLSLYWKCQLIGWSLAALYWGYTGFIGGGFNWWFGILQFSTDVTLYILLTHLYRNFSLRHNWQNLNLNQTVKRLIPTVVIMGVAYTLVTIVKIYLLRKLFVPGFEQPFSVFAGINGSSVFIAGIRLMSIWLLAYHMYQYAQREIRINKENARLAIISRDAQLNNLSAQLNPHFLFNSLNNIKALVIDNPKSARRAIDLLSDLLRNALYQKNGQLSTIKSEMDLVNDYLELERMRIEDRLQQQINVEYNLSGINIPQFSIQTLVENAIKHGIAQQPDGGTIYINITAKEGFVKINVENPGTLNDERLTTGIGLKNLQERLQLQYQGNAKVVIAQQPNGMVLATILIPLS